jgi:hypothetical protein
MTENNKTALGFVLLIIIVMVAFAVAHFIEWVW